MSAAATGCRIACCWPSFAPHKRSSNACIRFLSLKRPNNNLFYIPPIEATIDKGAHLPAHCIPRRSLGQNFLTDDVILADIVSASGIKSGDLVIEVGPGTGNLTRHLLAAGARITAVEKDDTLVRHVSNDH